MKDENGETISLLVPDDYFNNHDNLIYRFKDELHEHVVRLPKGSWDIMEALVSKILKYVPGDIVEIGMGESTQIFSDHAYQAGVKLYSCDIKMGGMFNVFKDKLFEDHICYIGKSEDFIKVYTGNPSIVFLDGEHTSETSSREVDFFLPLLKEGGVMFMHDTFPPYEHQLVKDKDGFKPGDVYLTRQKLEDNPDVDVLTWPYSAHFMGLTMVMKHKQDRPYWLKKGRGHETVKQ